MAVKGSSKGDIESAAREAVRVIALATEAAAKTISTAAEAATRVVAANASEAAKVVATTGVGDHDLLIEFKSETKVRMEDLKNAIQSLNDAISSTLKDHEQRIRSLEQNMWVKAGVSSVVTLIIGYAVAYGLKLVH